MIIRMWETRRSMAIQIAVGSTSRQVAASLGRDMLTVTMLATGGGIAVGLLGYLMHTLVRKLPVQIGVSGALATAAIGLLIAGLLGAFCYLYFRGKSVAQYLHD
jgi:ABC-type antimicrobial peptide transport system permease subunit